MPTIRTAADVRTSILATLESRQSGIRTDAGEPIVDLADAVSIEAGRANVISDYLRRINSIPGWLSVVSDTSFQAQLADALGISSTTTTSSFLLQIGAPSDVASDVAGLIFVDLSNYAASLGRPRKAATPATSTERLFLSSSSSFTLSRGATVQRSANSTVFYDTTETISVSAPAQDPLSGRFYVDVSIQCRTPGRAGNTIVGAINTSIGSLPGVTAVSNTVPAQGGFDRESDADLLTALENRQSGSNTDTLFGLLNFVKDRPDVIDALLVGPGDPLMQRSTAGAVDIYIIGSNILNAVATAKVDFSGELFTIPFQPVQSISSVTDNSGNSFFFGGGFTVIPDTGPMSGSAYAHTQLQWAPAPPGGVGPAVGAIVTIVYSYDALIQDIQRRLDTDPQVNVPAWSVLVREGTLVGVAAQLTAVPIAGLSDLGLSQSDVDAAVQTALTNYLDALKLGQPADYSLALEAAGAAQANGVSVVDHIDGFMIAEVGNVLGFSDLTVQPNQYLRLATFTPLT